MNQLIDVMWCFVVYSFKNKDKDFEFNPLLYREPMESLEHRSNMVPDVCSCQQSGSNILNTLKFVDNLYRGTTQQGVAIVELGSDECMNETFQ
jgi:hypothetical protein